jgi:hypothetical protein
MDDEVGEIHEVCSENMHCEKCKREHFCDRCSKSTHICRHCGKLTHECDICGAILNSLKEMRDHRQQSKICKKVRTMTPIYLQEQMLKFKQTRDLVLHQRGKSLPTLRLEN